MEGLPHGLVTLFFALLVCFSSPCLKEARLLTLIKKRESVGGKAKEGNKWMKGGLLNNQSSQVPIYPRDLS